jgi:hypothetical protein
MRQNNDASCFLFKNAFSFTDFPLDRLKATVSSRGRPIFQQTTDNVSMFQETINEEDPKQQDKKRIQLTGLNIPEKFRRKYSHVRDILTIAFQQCSQYEIYPESILLSTKNCIAQSYHFDYDPDNVDTRHCFVALIGFEDTTTLETISIVDDIELEKQISFNKGDLLLFRGDFIHAGSAYANANVRLHFYIEPMRMIGRPEDKTYFFYSDEPRYNRTIYMKEKGKLNLITHRINMQASKDRRLKRSASAHRALNKKRTLQQA